jgi:hypothetical protein
MRAAQGMSRLARIVVTPAVASDGNPRSVEPRPLARALQSARTLSFEEGLT